MSSSGASHKSTEFLITIDSKLPDSVWLPRSVVRSESNKVLGSIFVSLPGWGEKPGDRLDSPVKVYLV